MRRLVALTLLCVGMFRTLDAATIDQSVQSIILEDWSYGLNTADDPGKLQLTMTPSISNLYVDEVSGDLVTRNGYTVVINTPTLSKITFMYQFVKDNGDNELIVSDSSRVLTTRDFRTFTLVKATLTPTALLRAAQIRGKVWFTNGVDPVFTWDGNVHSVLDGNNGTPNVPRCKYIAFYQERAWLFNNVSQNYALYFSALTSSSNAAAIAPDDFRAWLTNNQLNIGQGDPLAGSGIDVFKGQLVLHKSNGTAGAIYTLFGTDEFTYFARKTNAEVGTNSNDSIVQLDNLEYFTAKDGVYAFDGSESKRISDSIKPDIENVISNLTRIVSQTWDTKADFDKGAFTRTSSTPAGFLVTANTTTLYFNTIGIFVAPTDPNYVQLDFATTASSQAVMIPTGTIPLDFIGDVPTVSIWERGSSGGGQIAAHVKNLRTGQLWTQTISINNSASFEYLAFSNFTSTFSSNPTWTRSDILLSSFTIQFNVVSGFGPGTSWQFYPTTTPFYSNVTLQEITTAQYVSDVATASIVNYWGQFAVSDFKNGGSILYYIRGATSAFNISTEAWTAIVPGSNVGLPIAKNYIQWAATFSNVGQYADYVTIQHNEGASDDNRPFGIPWRARYILSVTTDANSMRSVQFVKSITTNQNPIAWMRWDGIYIRSLCIFGSNLYGGGASTGTIYRLDYGQNDAGAEISWFYETPNMSLGSRFFEKMLQSLIIEVERNGGGAMTLSRSVNGGTYSDSSIALDGSGRYFYESLTAQEKGKYFKFKFSGSTLDRVVNIHSFGILYKPLNTR